MRIFDIARAFRKNMARIGAPMLARSWDDAILATAGAAARTEPAEPPPEPGEQYEFYQALRGDEAHAEIADICEAAKFMWLAFRRAERRDNVELLAPTIVVGRHEEVGRFALGIAPERPWAFYAKAQVKRAAA